MTCNQRRVPRISPRSGRQTRHVLNNDSLSQTRSHKMTTWTCRVFLLICFAPIAVRSHDGQDLWGGITNLELDIRAMTVWNREDVAGNPHLERAKRWIESEEVGHDEPEVALERQKRLFGYEAPTQCSEDMKVVQDYMAKKYKSYSETPHWQRQMTDANAGLPGGLTRAFIVWSGDFYECVKLKAWRNTNQTEVRKPDIVGKYCLSIIGVVVIGTPLRAGFCVPESCTKVQAQNILSRGKLPFRIFIDHDFCQTDAPPAWDSLSTYIWWLFVSLGMTVLLATIYDVWLHLKKWLKTRRELGTSVISMKDLTPSTPQLSKCQQLVIAFSALTNTQKILDTSPASNDASYLGNIHGLKAITMLWVVVGHCCVMLNQVFAWKNGVDILEFLKYFWLQIIGGAEFSVDTFITITGFLVVFVVMKESQKHGGRFNPLIFYVHRIIRIWPPFALLIAYTCGISAHMPTGPIGPAAFKDMEICRKIWWKALLFIQVYFMEKEKCLPHIWYLCIDIFFVFVSPLFLFPLLKKPKVGYGVLTVMFIASIATPFMLIHLHDLGAFPARNISAKKRTQFMHEVYDVPWGRIHCFIIGAVAGYIYFKKAKNLKLNKIFVAFVWSVVGSIMFAIVFGTLDWSSGKKPMSHNWSVFYGTFTRPLWSMCISWIIISCATGYGGVVNSILSWKMFIPFSRLSYSAYLVHFSVIGHLVASAKQPYMVDLYFMFYLITSVFFVTMAFAWGMAILIEAPVIQAEGLLMRTVVAWMNRKGPAVLPSPDRLDLNPRKVTIANGPIQNPHDATMTDNLIAIDDAAHFSKDLGAESDSEVFWDIADLAGETEIPAYEIKYPS